MTLVTSKLKQSIVDNILIISVLIMVNSFIKLKLKHDVKTIQKSGKCVLNVASKIFCHHRMSCRQALIDNFVRTWWDFGRSGEIIPIFPVERALFYRYCILTFLSHVYSSINHYTPESCIFLCPMTPLTRLLWHFCGLTLDLHSSGT